MSFIKRLLNSASAKRALDPEKTADDLFGAEAEKRRSKEEKDTDRIIQKATQNTLIHNLMREIGLTEDHIRDVYRRLMLHGDKKMAINAIANAELLRWYYFNGGKDRTLTYDQAIQLFAFAKNGRL